MICGCGRALELNKYTREHQDGLGAKFLYECPDEECEISTREVVRGHKPAMPRSKAQMRADYFRHALEIPIGED